MFIRREVNEIEQIIEEKTKDLRDEVEQLKGKIDALESAIKLLLIS